LEEDLLVILPLMAEEEGEMAMMAVVGMPEGIVFMAGREEEGLETQLLLEG
jgi:hypothetical protein